jgi:hypothetical protein
MQPITFKSTEMQHARAFICAGARHRTAYYFLAGMVFLFASRLLYNQFQTPRANKE